MGDQMNKKMVGSALLFLVGVSCFFMTGKKEKPENEKFEKPDSEPKEKDEAAERARIAREWAAEQGRKGAQKRWAKKKAENKEPVNNDAGVLT